MKKYLLAIKSKKGFSLVEMLIYMGLFSIILTSLMQLFGSILDVKFESEATSAVTQDGRYIISRLTYDIHQADLIDSPSLGNQAPTLHITGSGMDYTYSLDGDNNLQISDNLASPTTVNQLNSADTTVSNLSFTTLGNTTGKKTVQVSLDVKSKVLRRGENQIETFKTTIGTR